MSVVDDAIEFLEDLIMGDFKENPSNMSIIANALIGLIPVADQVLDVRDVAGMVCRIAKKGPANCTVDDWVDLSFAAIGCIPEVGSLFKGIFKPLWKSRKVVKKIDAKTWSSIDRMLGMSKGSSIKYLKTFPWAKRKVEALQYINDAFVGLDQLLAFLSEPRWWVPDSLELLAKKMRPLVKQVREPIKKGFDLGFKAMQDFVIDMIGEEGYKVVNAAATIALSTGNNPKNKHEKSKVKLVENNAQKKKSTSGGKTASKSTGSKATDKKVDDKKAKTPVDQKKQPTKKVEADKKVDAKKAEADKKKAEAKKRADHDKVSGNERQNVEKGKGTQTNAVKSTLKKIEELTNKYKGILGEHMADYYCQEKKGWGKNTAKHDTANTINTHKLNDGGKMVQLFELKSRGRGIDGVWKTDGELKPYAIIEAKCSQDPTSSLKSLLGTSDDKTGIDKQIPQKQKKQTGRAPNRTEQKVNTIGKEKYRNSQNKVVQMSHHWIANRLTKAVGSATLARTISKKRRYVRYVMFFSNPQIIKHEETLIRFLNNEQTDDSMHKEHEITRIWNDSDITAVVNN